MQRQHASVTVKPPHQDSTQRPPSPLATLDRAIARRQGGRPVWAWFDTRVKSHHAAFGMPPGTPLRQPLAAAALREAMDRPVHGRTRLVYVHVPFCQTICRFCAFTRRPVEGADTKAYLRALGEQIADVARTRWAEAGPIDAVYIGGGTPTALAAGELAGVLRTLRGSLPLSPVCEVTVESAFRGIDRAYLETLADNGAERLSFGVQSFDTHVRRLVGRVASCQAMLDTLETAANLGFRSLSADLMNNLPGQTRAIWEADLATLCKAPVTGCSVYSLIPFERSQLTREIAAGAQPPLGDLSWEYEAFALADSALDQREGWRRFSPVHFGKIGTERNTYNAHRALPADIVGLGAGAGGRIGDVHYMNPTDVDAYIAAWLRGGESPAFALKVHPGYDRLRLAFLLTEGLRIDPATLPKDVPEIRALFADWETLGAVEQEDGTWHLSRAGAFWAYNLSAMLAETLYRTLAPVEPRRSIEGGAHA